MRISKNQENERKLSGQREAKALQNVLYGAYRGDRKALLEWEGQLRSRADDAAAEHEAGSGSGPGEAG